MTQEFNLTNVFKNLTGVYYTGRKEKSFLGLLFERPFIKLLLSANEGEHLTRKSDTTMVLEMVSPSGQK